MDDPTLSHTLLVVEDSDEDYEIFSRIIREVDRFDLSIARCVDGEDALDYLMSPEDHPLPDLVLLDLNLPGTDGREVLAELKQDDRLKVIPVVVLTTSSNPEDVYTCYYAGVSGYLLKSFNPNQFRATMHQFLEFWFQATVLPSSN
ncbi:response regulator [Acaryochloris sp. CCMEE 5410]|uniref:response regulator n=1 Tax=Acaryochloris sp. CCMEE 5410 TaxID=310037 RepID=UPI00024848BC|nr:response regulator [Acaryochloris sp. CCMEE 5410]KAI9132262.1 response regulator [Acaryochloris sp. CCMEE 5410]